MESANLQLINRLAGELDAVEAAALVPRIVAAAHKPAAILALLDELEAISAKAVRAAIEALPELDRRAGCSQIHAWLDLGVALAASSGAIALKYFKDSPLIFGLIERSDRQAAVLAMALGSGAGLISIVVPAALSWLLQMLVLAIVSRRSEVSAVYALTAPLGLALIYAMLFDSGVRITTGRGVTWKGRKIYERHGVPPPRIVN